MGEDKEACEMCETLLRLIHEDLMLIRAIVEDISDTVDDLSADANVPRAQKVDDAFDLELENRKQEER
jgi:hypothetical protein